ncbi:MAG: glycoside hydrolase TIM-barrel-like domain-containing protein [Candidatus Midichloria sp.]|nr:glycoside hydrolase TIM-barrel-like domain-containing protein [Candidatus Midichloria sp.]
MNTGGAHTHYDPDGKKTPWIAKSKKIWFTELGFPSVNAATNQPNVFFDVSSLESNFPKGSNRQIDFAM